MSIVVSSRKIALSASAEAVACLAPSSVIVVSNSKLKPALFHFFRYVQPDHVLQYKI